MRILLTGSSGQIGWEIRRALSGMGEIVAPDRNELDLTRAESIRSAVRQIGPALIINAGGHTAVDRAEAEPALAYAANADGPRVLAEEADRCGAALIHYSTDYVFDGCQRTPYMPADSPNPLNTYGATKLAGEEAVLLSGANVLVLRTSWVFGTRRTNFMNTMLKLAATISASRPLRVVNDQTGCPTWCHHVATATAQIIRGSLVNAQGRWNFGSHRGVFHVSCSRTTTWFDFARAIFEAASLANPPKIIPVSSEEYGAPARRPAYSVLDCIETQRTFGIELPNWRNALTDAIALGSTEAELPNELRSHVA